jgi:hypothetical protein
LAWRSLSKKAMSLCLKAGYFSISCFILAFCRLVLVDANPTRKLFTSASDRLRPRGLDIKWLRNGRCLVKSIKSSYPKWEISLQNYVMLIMWSLA